MELTSDDIFLLKMLSKYENYNFSLDQNKIMSGIENTGNLYLDKKYYSSTDNTEDLANKLAINHVANTDSEFLGGVQALDFCQRVDGLTLYPLVKLFYDLKNPIDTGDEYMFKPLSDKVIYEFIKECNASGILNQALDDDDMDDILDEDILNENMPDKNITYLN